jgi:hypothetical protein
VTPNNPEPTAPREWKDDDVVGILREDVAKDSDILFRELLPEVQALLRGQAERDLTPEEAFAEAQKRWGEYATVKDHGRMFYQGRKITEDDFAVGDCTGVIFHSNKSYRAAFASADKAEAEREKK